MYIQYIQYSTVQYVHVQFPVTVTSNPISQLEVGC